MECQPPTTACPTRSSRWRGTSSTGSTSAATSACSTRAAAPAASPRSSLERVPTARVIAVDGSQAMVDADAQALGDRVEAFAADLVELTSTSRSTRSSRPRPSTGSPTTSGCSRACTRRCGRAASSSAQCGGAGNIANVQAAIDAVDHPGAARLGRPVELRHARADDRAPARGRLQRRLDLAAAVAGRARRTRSEYFTTVILGSHLERLPAEDREPFVDAVLAHSTSRSARTTCG